VKCDVLMSVFQLGHAKLHCVTPSKIFVEMMRVDFFFTHAHVATEMHTCKSLFVTV